MTKDKPKTLLKQYFQDHKIRVKDVVKATGISRYQFYKLLRGDCRPNNINTKKIYDYLKGGLTKDQIQPSLHKERCPCCQRVLKPYLFERLHLSEKKTRKSNIKPIEKKVTRPLDFLDF